MDILLLNLHVYLAGLAVIAALAIATWMVSVVRRDVSIVDSLWSILFLAATITYIYVSPSSPRDTLLLALVAAWALRLAIYLTARNWAQPEDHRYQKIRARNQPNFAFKSLYLVFLLQGLLAWIVSLPLLASALSAQPLMWLDYIGVGIVVFGTLFESIADWQLSRFKADVNNKGRVLNTGLWRYTRHPNYFGEFCVWWGFYLIAVAAGGWWALPGPLLMSVLLLKVSGVSLLEKDIGERRPAYRDYILSTNAFIPGPPKDR
jgi:steroid 5-alpha reductase family enzyme